MDRLSAFRVRPDRYLGWLRRLRRDHAPGTALLARPAMIELLDTAAVNVELVCDRVRTSRVEVELDPDWADLLARVEQANESLRRAIEGLGCEQPTACYGSIENRPMLGTLSAHTPAW
jgi:hypothetical protein